MHCITQKKKIDYKFEGKLDETLEILILNVAWAQTVVRQANFHILINLLSTIQTLQIIWGVSTNRLYGVLLPWIQSSLIQKPEIAFN